MPLLVSTLTTSPNRSRGGRMMSICRRGNSSKVRTFHHPVVNYQPCRGRLSASPWWVINRQESCSHTIISRTSPSMTSVTQGRARLATAFPPTTYPTPSPVDTFDPSVI